MVTHMFITYVLSRYKTNKCVKITSSKVGPHLHTYLPISHANLLNDSIVDCQLNLASPSCHERKSPDSNCRAAVAIIGEVERNRPRGPFRPIFRGQAVRML